MVNKNTQTTEVTVMCKECDKIQLTFVDTPRANRRRLNKLLKDPQHIVKTWEPDKWCSQCEKRVLKEEFGKCPRKRPDGRVYYDFRNACRRCLRNKQRKDYRTDLNKRAAKMVQGIKTRCKKNNLSFDLDVEWLHDIFQKGVCQVTNLPFDFGGGIQEKGHRAFTPSLDRTDPTLGYNKENVKVVCWAYNAAKGVGTHKDVLKLAGALINGHK